jgi:hypothetical protein
VQHIVWSPARHDTADVATTYLRIAPHTAPTLACLMAQPDWCWGAETGVNTAGVAIGNETIYTTLDPRQAPAALTGLDDSERAAACRALGHVSRRGRSLPPDLLARIRTNLVADGVLFVRVHSFRPYPPVSLGWDARLVTVSTGQTLWSIDEAFDAGQADVARAARDYFRDHHTGPSELADPQADLRSPAHFTRYAAQAALATLPAR